MLWDSREYILWVVGIAVAAVLTFVGTKQVVNWLAPTDPYGGTVQGTGKLPKGK